MPVTEAINQLEGALKKLLSGDEEVNKDVTKVLEKIIPEIREVALDQLSSSLEVYFEEQNFLLRDMASALSQLIEC